VTCIENKNYSGALNLLTNIKAKTESYKDMQDLLALASAQQTKSFILFEPNNESKTKGSGLEKDIEDQLFNDFNQAATQKFKYARIINNTPFKFIPDASAGGGNVDLIQAVRKATGADYFYLYDVSNKKEFNSGPQKSGQTAYLKQTSTSGTVVTVSYQQVGYSNVKLNRSYSYQYHYKLINAFNNQIVSSQTQNVNAQDGVEYNEFNQKFNQNNLNNLFPYNPAQTAPVAQYNPNNWRKLFSANPNLKSFDQLKSEALNQTVNIFTNSVINNIK
jgi:hypothetical protein